MGSRTDPNMNEATAVLGRSLSNNKSAWICLKVLTKAKKEPFHVHTRQNTMDQPGCYWDYRGQYTHFTSRSERRMQTQLRTFIEEVSMSATGRFSPMLAFGTAPISEDIERQVTARKATYTFF